MSEEQWLTLTQAAEQSGYSMRLIQRLLAQGKIKGFKPGRDWLTTLEAVMEYKSKARRGRPPKEGWQQGGA